MDIIIAVFGLTLIVVIHELGHALAAVYCNVKVETFSIGFGRGYRFKISNTVVNLGPILLGGYVRLSMADVEKCTLPKKLLISVSGMLANIVTASVFLFIAGKSILESLLIPVFMWLAGWFLAFSELGTKMFEPDSFAGPVGIVGMISTGGLTEYFFNLAVISIALAMFNLLPILPLDGGRMALDVMNKLFPGKMGSWLRAGFTLFSVVIIGSLIVIVLYNEISSLF